jgi:transcriptional regulator with XRE-family HTH domain
MRDGDNHLLRREKAIFARRLQEAIERMGLTYKETARHARDRLPPGARLSAVSVWQYAHGKTFPRSRSYIEALGQVLDITPDELLAPPSPREALSAADGPDSHPPDLRINLEDLGNGQARLNVTLDLSWPAALQVLRIVSKDLDDKVGPEE